MALVALVALVALAVLAVLAVPEAQQGPDPPVDLVVQQAPAGLANLVAQVESYRYSLSPAGQC